MFKHLALSLGLACLASMPSQAAPQTLIISGGKDNGPTGREYYLDCEMVYIAERGRGIDPIVVAEDGTWKFVKNKKHLFPAFGHENLEAAFQLIQANLSPGDPVDIHISDHGAPAETGDDPWNGCFVLFQQASDTPPWAVSHKQLKDLIERYIPPSSLVRLVGSYCFAGGLHHISFQLPNVCSSTLTDFLNPAGRILGHHSFATSFWLRIMDRLPTNPASVYSAHWAAMPWDILNEGRGSLSSMSYVDSILGLGPYGEAGLPIAACDKFLKTFSSQDVLAVLKAQTLKQATALETESKSEGLDEATASTPTRHYVFADDSDHTMGNAGGESKEEKVAKPFVSASEGTEEPWELLEPGESTRSSAMVSGPGLSPSQARLLGLLQDDLRKEFKAKGKDCNKLVKDLKEMIHAEEEAKAPLSLPSKLFSYLGSWTGYVPAGDPSKEALIPYLYLQNKAENLRKTMLFLRSAKPDQIEKFFQLLAHELTPMGNLGSLGEGA